MRIKDWYARMAKEFGPRWALHLLSNSIVGLGGGNRSWVSVEGIVRGSRSRESFVGLGRGNRSWESVVDRSREAVEEIIGRSAAAGFELESGVQSKVR